MKRIISILVLVLLLFSATSVAFATENPICDNNLGNKHEFNNWKAGFSKEQLGEMRGRALKERIRVNGKFLDFDVPPVIKEGRTLIPVRAITRGLGADVDWNAETKTVTITRGDIVIIIKLDSKEYYVNGVIQEMDVPAQLISNRTFVPLRFIAQALGDRVNYDSDTGDIDIIGCLDTPNQPTLEDFIAEWEAVDNADNGYKLRLFHESELIESVEVDDDGLLNYDFSTEMQDSGCYTVSVTALATEDYTVSKESMPSEPQIVDHCVDINIIQGSIIALHSTTNQVEISYTEDGALVSKIVTAIQSTDIEIDGIDVLFNELKLEDEVTATLYHDVLVKLEVEVE